VANYFGAQVLRFTPESANLFRQVLLMVETFSSILMLHFLLDLSNLITQDWSGVNKVFLENVSIAEIFV
jgi:hypothetical protein